MARESEIRQEIEKKNNARLNILAENLRSEKENRKQVLENLIGPVRALGIFTVVL